MKSKDFDKIYKNVPKNQKEMLKEFRSKHPYKELNVNGVPWEYISCGNGNKTLLLFHGLLVNAHMWFHQIRAFENEFRIIAPTFSSEVMTVDEMCDSIARILEAEKLEKVTLIGISAGGAWAQYFVRKYPEKVEGLILSHTGIPNEKFARKANKMAKIVHFLPFFIIRALLKRRSKNYPGSAWNEFRRAYFNEVLHDITKEVLLSQLDADWYPSYELKPEDFYSWNGDTLILSTIDDKNSIGKVEELKALHPKERVQIFDSGGHHTVFLFPEEYNSVIRDFLEGGD